MKKDIYFCNVFLFTIGINSTAGNAVENANSLVDLLTVKTAKDLSLDLGIKGISAAPATSKK